MYQCYALGTLQNLVCHVWCGGSSSILHYAYGKLTQTYNMYASTPNQNVRVRRLIHSPTSPPCWLVNCLLCKWLFTGHLYEPSLLCVVGAPLYWATVPQLIETNNLYAPWNDIKYCIWRKVKLSINQTKYSIAKPFAIYYHWYNFYF